MLYRVLRILVGWCLKVYFRRIHVSGVENIPHKRPIILGCNHPNAFLEACATACYQPRHLHFLVRGDVFKNKLARYFLEATNQIPIYRFRDGFSKLKENHNTFQKSHDLLNEGAAIIMYPEGSTAMVKQLRPLQKGLAKLVFGATVSYPESDIAIVPVGVNYTRPYAFRSEVMINFGKPIDVSDYWSEYKSDQHSAIKNVTDHLYQSMKPLIVHYNDQADEEPFEMALSFYRATYQQTEKGVFLNDRQFKLEKYFADQVNALPQVEKSRIKESIDSLQDVSLNLDDVVGHKPTTPQFLLWLVLSPLALFGLVIHYPAAWLSNYISTRKVEPLEFRGGVRLGLWMVFTVITVIVILVLALIFQNAYLALFGLLFPFLGKWSVEWKEGVTKYFSTFEKSEAGLKLKSAVKNIIKM